MTDELPACSRFASDRARYRVWKRLFHHAGKQRAFDQIEPKIRSLSSKIRNRMHPTYADESLVQPLERKRKLLTAFDEIRQSQEPVTAEQIADDIGVFIYGTTGIAMHVLFAGACLVHAMLAKDNFEYHLISCVSELSAVDRGFVKTLGSKLRVRPTWFLRTGLSGTLSLFGNGR